MAAEIREGQDGAEGEGGGKGKGYGGWSWNDYWMAMSWGYWPKGKGKGGPRKPRLTPEEETEKAQKYDDLEDKLLQGIKAGVRRAGGKLQLAQCGSIAEVSQLRKDYEKEMKEVSLLLFVKHHEDVFRMEPSPKTPDASAANIVSLVNPNDGSNLPDAEIPIAMTGRMTIVERWQALRRLIIRAVQRCGGNCGLENIGQETSIQELRKGLPGGARLLDFIRKFPTNFEIQANNNKAPKILLLSADTTSAPVGGWPTEASFAGSGKGFAKGSERPGAGGGRGGGGAPRSAFDPSMRNNRPPMQQTQQQTMRASAQSMQSQFSQQVSQFSAQVSQFAAQGHSNAFAAQQTSAFTQAQQQAAYQQAYQQLLSQQQQSASHLAPARSAAFPGQVSQQASMYRYT